MRETSSLIKSFDSSEDSELIDELGRGAEEVFLVPKRNWNGLIEDYNRSNKRKFMFTPLQCKTLVDYAKRSVPIVNVFVAMGVSKAKYNDMLTQAQECEEKLQELSVKETLTDEEYSFFHDMLRHPLRILLSDIERAEGISKVMDWEEFNKNVEKYPEVQLTKMKARFRDYFNEKETQTGGVNVTISLGGNFIEDI